MRIRSIHLYYDCFDVIYPISLILRAYLENNEPCTRETLLSKEYIDDLGGLNNVNRVVELINEIITENDNATKAQTNREKSMKTRDKIANKIIELSSILAAETDEVYRDRLSRAIVTLGWVLCAKDTIDE